MEGIEYPMASGAKERDNNDTKVEYNVKQQLTHARSVHIIPVTWFTFLWIKIKLAILSIIAVTISDHPIREWSMLL